MISSTPTLPHPYSGTRNKMILVPVVETPKVLKKAPWSLKVEMSTLSFRVPGKHSWLLIGSCGGNMPKVSET